MTTAGKEARRKRPPPTPWHRATPARPCPVCRLADCLIAGPRNHPTAVVCLHVESLERIGTAGWLHVLDDRGPVSAIFRGLLI